MKYTLGIDLGTSYFKAGLFDAEGNLCGLGRVEVKKRIDNGIRCELAIEDFWRFLQQAIEQAKAQAQAATGDIIAMGYSSQANTFVLLDENDMPLTPLIVWSDGRAANIYHEVRTLWNLPHFLRVTALGIDCPRELCINKLLWFQEHQRSIWDRTDKILTICDYLVYGLTGRRVVDTGSTSLTGILDIHRATWAAEALAALHIEPDKLSKPVLSGTLAGAVTQKAFAAQLGVPVGIPMFLGSLDHYMAAVGAGLGTTAQATVSLGTVVACVNHTPHFAPQKGICIAMAIAGRGYHQLAWDMNGAVALEWYNRTFCPELTISQLVDAAASVSSDCNGLIAKPNANQYEGLQGFENIRKPHTHGHFARAIMQSVADTLKRLIGQLCPDKRPQCIAATGGGAQGRLWLDICATTLNAEVFAADCPEPACKGAAMMARNP